MSANDERTLTIVEMRKRGNTLQEIGNTFGITRERVRQILEAENPRYQAQRAYLKAATRAQLEAAKSEPTKRLFEMSVEELRNEARRLRAIKSTRGATKRAAMLEVIPLWIKRQREK
jgi:hypothetical protein